MAVSTTSTQSIDIVRQFNSDVFNGRDYDRVNKSQTEDYVQRGSLTSMELHGNEESIEIKRRFHAGFSDSESIEELTFSYQYGEYVCSMNTYRGTHDSEFLGIAATDGEVEVQGFVFNHIEDNQIAGVWITVDFLDLIQQINLVPLMNELAA